MAPARLVRSWQPSLPRAERMRGAFPTASASFAEGFESRQRLLGSVEHFGKLVLWRITLSFNSGCCYWMNGALVLGGKALC